MQNSETIFAAYSRVFSIDGLLMDADSLLEDIAFLAAKWPDNEDFNMAVSSTIRAIELARDNRVTASPLRDDLAGWSSYHYQFSRGQGEPAELRLVYRCESDGSIKVMGFGHRFVPDDFYHRLATQREKA